MPFTKGCRFYELLKPWHSDEAPISGAERRRFWSGHGLIGRHGLWATFCIQLGKGGWKFCKGSTKDADIIGTSQVYGEGSRWGEPFEILRENLASATSAFATFERAEPGLEDIVGAINQAGASAAFLGNRNDVTPEVGAVPVEVVKNQMVLLRKV